MGACPQAVSPLDRGTARLRHAGGAKKRARNFACADGSEHERSFAAVVRRLLGALTPPRVTSRGAPDRSLFESRINVRRRPGAVIGAAVHRGAA